MLPADLPPSLPKPPAAPTVGHAAQRLHRVLHAAMQRLDAQLPPKTPPLESPRWPHAQAASSLTRHAKRSPAQIPQTTARAKHMPHIGVALSGGADSSAVLLAAVRQWPGGVRAVHIHHGLQAAADGFAAHCTALCARLDVPLDVIRVAAHAAAGESPEAKARDARYLALANWALGHQPNPAMASAPATSSPIPRPRAHVVLLGHHADDQVETMLLALSRGAGVAGLASMAPMFERHGAAFARPLLDVPAQDIRAWLRTEGLDWVEDPTNQDPRYTRNRIRRLLPALMDAFPQFRQTVARSARLCAQANELLSAQAQADWAQVCGQTNGAGLAAHEPPMNMASSDAGLDVKSQVIEAGMRTTQQANCATTADGSSAPRIALLQTLPPLRQAQALRHWLRSVHHTTPSEAQLDTLLRLIAACRTRGHRIDLRVGRGHVQRQGEVLVWRADAPA